MGNRIDVLNDVRSVDLGYEDENGKDVVLGTLYLYYGGTPGGSDWILKFNQGETIEAEDARGMLKWLDKFERERTTAPLGER